MRHVSLGFVTAANGTDCHPAWGGYPADPATGRQAFLLKAVTSFRRRGGEAIPSTTTTRNDCSGVAGARWEFSRALGAFRG